MVRRLVKKLYRDFWLKPSANRKFRRAVKSEDLTEAGRLYELHGDIIDINQRGYWTGRTLLHHAAASGNVEVGKFLIANRANGNLKTPFGRTAYEIAERKGRGRFLHELYFE